MTGAGRGIGREHALLLAAHGALVVVNDVGGGVDGSGADAGPAQQVVDEIEAAGGRAVANTDDVSDWNGARHLVEAAVETFGRLDVLVNNAGILRDRMLVNMAEDEWDAVMRVHVKGTVAMSRWAAAHWRERSKAGESVDARIVNTSSPSGLYGNVGQANYSAAKAAIAALTLVAAKELARYGVTVNAIAPSAITRMTAALVPEDISPEEQEAMAPRRISPLVCWLASTRSGSVTGRMFDVTGKLLSVAEGWHRGPSVEFPSDDPATLGHEVEMLVGKARPNADIFGYDEA